MGGASITTTHALVEVFSSYLSLYIMLNKPRVGVGGINNHPLVVDNNIFLVKMRVYFPNVE